MNLHEYQAKDLLARFGVPVGKGLVCETPQAALEAATGLFDEGELLVAVKSQVHSGGRGKGVFKDGYKGGVKVCQTRGECETAARAMLGNVLVTLQTGAEGRKVNKVLVSAAPKILRELYVALLLDRNTSRPVLMVSTEGGMDIEQVAAKNPEKILRLSIDPALGLMPYQARRAAFALGLRGGLLSPAAKLIQGLWNTWWNNDVSLLEINPLCLISTPDGKESLQVLDAKLILDDNGLIRHPDLRALRDLAEEAPLEVEAASYSLNYIKLDGNIACLVNGAGLAMATMDIIQHFGGRPANFLDVGGGATQEQVAAAFRIILSDPNVKGILVNIFGGIMDCNIIASGIVAAVKETKLKLPLVVRLEGNNVQAGRETLVQSGLTIISGESMSDAAQKVIKAVVTTQ
jgi:succinyl-CoA synthetase beta subunit